jgi:hypothetical protein
MFYNPFIPFTSALYYLHNYPGVQGQNYKF